MTTKLKVGILSSCQHSMFSGGLANSTIALIESFKALDHDVTFLNTVSTEWFDDCKILKSDVTVINIKKDEPILFDLIVELVPFFTSEQERKKFSKKSIAFHRKNILITTIEYSLYPIINTVMNYDGIDEVWCFDLVNREEVQILETITRKPIRILPYIWTPSILIAHEKEVHTPLWLQVNAKVALENEGRLPPWSPHIVETNITNTSSCTLPVLTIREAKVRGFTVKKYTVHNGEHIFKAEFFKENVYRHAQIEDLSSNYLGRQRLMDLVFEPMSCVISHVRFIDFKPMLFDLAWYGIPFVHNSTVLKDLPSFNRYYYPNNSISQAVKCLQALNEDLTKGEGWFNVKNIEDVRKSILQRYGPNNILPVLKSSIENLLKVRVKEPEKKKYVLLFTDMWDSMNPNYNFFTLMLKEANPSLDIEFYNERSIPTGLEPNIIIFGPFGNAWRSYPNVNKIHFTGENSPIIQDSNVKLNLGFQHADMVGEEYLRFPLWLLEIDWFNCDLDKIVNPKPIPLEACTHIWSPEERSKFCAFIVTNPCNEIRNKSFEWLSEYKHVDSAGRLFNNIGDKLFSSVGGGGGGELKKFEFLQQYKFALTYENSSSQGYTTEKLLHAKAAGCIPVYWGDPKVERDFNMDGCIDARNIKSKEELIKLVKTVDTDSELYKKKMSIPALDACKVDWCRRTISECARRILNIMTETNNSVERFIGSKVSKKPFVPTVVKNSSSEIMTPIVVTFATQEFLPSLNQWLAGIGAQRSVIKDLSVVVYLGNDISEEPKKKLLETFPFITYKYLPTTNPDDFKDIWEPQHFAWKLYVYQDMCNNYKDKIIFYMDAGSFLCRWPTEYLRLVQENNICVLTDEEQFNEQWCHDTFVSSLKVTNDELEKNQIVGGIMAFRAGSEKATNFFNEAWLLGQKRELIVGEKWSGLRNGKPYGHRHDQSILSILSLRHNLATYSLQNIYCDTSLRRTFITNKHLYVHRGLFKIHEPFLEGIDECFVINLKRRKDRLDKLYNNNPELKNRAIHSSAFEGVNLQLTESLYRLFKPHDFMWKKAIMGCALSHLNLWYQLMSEKPDIQNYLILEDDVKLQKGWEARWKEALPHIPENYDIIYLGGILPPNRQGFEACKDPINKFFSRVKENNFYGQNPPNRYFHFCAYSYVLSKQGAEKVIATLMGRDGYYTSADHILCNPVDFLNIYFLDPLVAGCYQDDDPSYANSQFNNFNRVDKFDSDLWNNDERFTEEEIKSVTNTKDLDIMKALQDAKLTSKKVLISPNKIVTTIKKITLYSLQKISWKDLYEKRWLEELFGHPDMIEVEEVDESTDFTGKTPIFLVMRPHLEQYNKLFLTYESVGQAFKVLHLSDEFSNDPIDFYTYGSCKMVLRNYARNNLPSNVTVIPLGYHHTSKQGIEKPYERTPQLPFRSYMWSFFGTRWNDRDKLLEPLRSIKEHRCELYDEWNDKNSLGEKEYLSVLLNSWSVPCIGGNNGETYRFYEALECGSVPIIVEDESNRNFIKYITHFLPLTIFSSYDELRELIGTVEIFEQYRYSVLNAYSSMKKHFQDKSKELLN